MINGHSSFLIMGGAARQRGLARPVIGPRCARITRPLDADPDWRGPFGRAWLCDLDAARGSMGPDAYPDATLAHWIIEAPWSHEVVHSYSLVLVHLRFSFHHQPVTRYLEGATHAVDLFAINPAAPREEMLRGPINPTMWVPPIAFAAQIVALDDDAAAVRVRHAVELVCAGRLSPHPDHARAWAEIFGDNMLRHAQAPEPEAEETDQ